MFSDIVPSRSLSQSLLIGVIWLLSVGCDQDRFLSGQWVLDPGQAIDTVPLGCIPGRMDAESGQPIPCEKYVELSLGHFGREVVGVLRFYDNEERFDPTRCTADNRCACQWIEGRFENDQLQFKLQDCEGRRYLTRFAVDSSSELTWELRTFDGALLTEHKLIRRPGNLNSADKTCECEQSP